MKQKSVVCVAAAAAICLLMAACHTTAEAGLPEPETAEQAEVSGELPQQTEDPTKTGTQIANPIHPQASLTELNAADGNIPLSAPAEATNVSYQTIGDAEEQPVGEIDFSFNGTEYTLRGIAAEAELAEALAGVYETPSETESSLVKAGSKSVEVALMKYPSGAVAQWRWDGWQYALYGRDLADVWDISHAMYACAQLTAGLPESTTAEDFISATYTNIWLNEDVQTFTVDQVQPLSPEQVAADPDLSENQADWAETTWAEYLAMVPAAKVLQVDFTVLYTEQGREKGPQYGDGSYTQYALVSQGENGAWYLVGVSFL